MDYSKEYLQFKMMIFHCYVSFPAGMSDVFLLKFQRFSAPGEFDNVKPKSFVQSCFSHRRKSFVMFAKIHPVSLLWLHLKGHDSMDGLKTCYCSFGALCLFSGARAVCFRKCSHWNQLLPVVKHLSKGRKKTGVYPLNGFGSVFLPAKTHIS